MHKAGPAVCNNFQFVVTVLRLLGVMLPIPSTRDGDSQEGCSTSAVAVA